MNYLAHFVFNHEICGYEAQPYFVMGVALPDLWPRFSRTRRIRWRAVRGREPGDAIDTQLRAGLLNHADVDRRFHVLPSFLRWQRELKARVDDGQTHSMLLDFLTHLAIELAIDHHLVRADAEAADRFYEQLAVCDLALAEQRVGELADVNTDGLGEVIRGFLARRFLHRYRGRTGLLTVMQRVLELAAIRDMPSSALVEQTLDHATTLVVPQRIWAELCPSDAQQHTG